MKSAAMFGRKRRGLVITRIMARDGDRCAICGGRLDRSIPSPRAGEPQHPDLITFDHKEPRAVGGVDRFDNIRLAHYRCNQTRGDASIEEP